MAPKEVKKEKREKPEEEEKDKVPQPDRAVFDEKLAKIQEDIDKLQKKQKELSATISGRSGGKDEFFAKKAELRAQLDEFKAKMDGLMDKKNAIKESMGAKRQESRDMRDELNKAKRSLPFSSEEEINDRINAIEFQLSTESMSLKAEKDLLKEIAELKKSKPKVASLHKLEHNVSNFDPGMNMKDQLSAISEEFNIWREKKSGVQAEMGEIMEARKAQLGDLPQVQEERDALGNAVREKIQERNTVRDEFRQAEREYNAHLNEQRKVRQERAMEDRKSRQAEYDQRRLEREAEKLDDQPFVAEITLIEQTISFCKSLMPAKQEEKKEEAKEIKHDIPDGGALLVKKEDRDEFWFAPTKGKKSKGQRQANAKQSSKPIKHNAETFKLFDKLKLDAPITTTEIPGLIEKLDAQLATYNDKVKEWEEKRDEMKRKILEGGVVPQEKKAEEAKAEETKAEGEEEKAE